MLGILSRASARAAAAIALLAAAPLWAQSAYEFDVPAQALDTALRVIGQKSSTNILFEPALVKGLKSPALRAKLTADEAIEQLLDGTELRGQRTSSDTIVVRNGKSDSSPPVNSSAELERQGGSGGNSQRCAEPSSGKPNSTIASNQPGLESTA